MALAQPTSTRLYVGRLAPSPTGLLHLGHARTFWITFQRARAANGKLWLRDEDLDPHRSRVEFATAMREDLQWLGITWDAEAKQSERLAWYRDAMQKLLASGYVYPCQCSRADLQRATQAPHEDDDEPIYRGTCRPSHPPIHSAVEADTNYRFRVPDGEIIHFTDLNAALKASAPDAMRPRASETSSYGARTVCPATNSPASLTTQP